MTPRLALVVWLTCAAAAAAAPASPTAADAAAVVAKIGAAFEKGEAVENAVTPDELLVLETAPVTAREQAALYRRLPQALKRAGAFQKMRPPRLPACPDVAEPGKDPSVCVLAAGRAFARELGVAQPERQEAAAALHLSLYLGPQGTTPADVAAARARGAELLRARRVTGANPGMGRVMAQNGLLGTTGDPGATAGPSVAAAAGPGYRGLNAALAEARRAAPTGPTTVRPGQVPSWSQRLLASAEEDGTILEHGRDDGTVGTAVGRGLTVIKKGGSEMLSYFVNGDTWRRTGQGALQMVSNPGETARFLPGALKEAGAALWKGVKTDISTASDEVGKFIEDPTPYRGAAVVGSVGLAVSNAFFISSGKSAVRQGAKVELTQASGQAARLADNLIGAADDTLDFRTLARPASEYQTATRDYARRVRAGEPIEAAPLQGRIGVDRKVYQEVESVGVQHGSDCARYGIASCSIANGAGVTKDRVEQAAAAVIVRDAEDSVRMLEIQARDMRARGKPSPAIEQELVKARTRLVTTQVGMSAENGIDFSAIGATLREMDMPHRSLGMDPGALAALRRGEVPPSVLEYQRKVDAELVRGNAVMAALYTGTDGAHAQHAVTILGKGRDASGRVVYEIYDSNVGRVIPVPADAVRVYGAVVVGRT